MKQSGELYILTNPGLKTDYVKVGVTRRCSHIRAKELSATTSVPKKFKVYKSWSVEDIFGSESRVHDELASRRVNEDREFFHLWAPFCVLIIWWLKFTGEIR